MGGGLQRKVLRLNAKRIKRISLRIALFFALSLSLQIAHADDDICQGLMTLHAKHGVELESYLSDAGKNCLMASASTDSAGESFEYEQSFVGTEQLSVELQFSPGMYWFRLKSPRYNSDRHGNMRYLGLSDVAEAPANCITKAEDDAIYFPSLIQIDQNCKVNATLGEIGSSSDHKYKVNISRYSPRDPARTLKTWTKNGMGSAYNIVDIALLPGVYRFNLHSPDQDNLGTISLEHIISDPPGCFGPTRIAFPSQVTVNRECRVYAILNSYLVIDLVFWNVSINRNL